MKDLQATGGVIVCNGTVGLYLEDVNAHSLQIGNQVADNPVPRPINQVHWTDLTVTGITFGNPQSPCLGSDFGCESDVNDDDNINVSDLLAVITGWGPCPSPWFDAPLGGECNDLPAAKLQ